MELTLRRIQFYIDHEYYLFAIFGYFSGNKEHFKCHIKGTEMNMEQEFNWTGFLFLN